MRILPEIILSVFAVLIMVLEPFVGAAHKKLLGWMALLGVAAAGAGHRPARSLPLAGNGTGFRRSRCRRRFRLLLHLSVFARGRPGHSGLAWIIWSATTPSTESFTPWS